MTREPFADVVQAALLRPERFLLPLHSWKLIKNAAEPVAAKVARQMANTPVFRLEDEFTAAAQSLANSSPEQLLAMMQVAQLPFDAVWLEWNERVRIVANNKEPSHDWPFRGAYLLERSSCSATGIRGTPFWQYDRASMGAEPALNLSFGVRQFLDSMPHASVAINIMSIQWDAEGTPLTHPWPAVDVKAMHEPGQQDQDKFKPLLDLCSASSLNMNKAFLLGARYVNDHAPGSPLYTEKAVQAILALAQRVETTLGHGSVLNFGEDWQSVVAESKLKLGLMFLDGDVRFLIAVLYLLQHKGSERITSRSAGGTRLVHTSRTKWMDVHECRITAPRERIVTEAKDEATRAARHAAAAKRRHGVMGHWAERIESGAAACLHVYRGAVLGRQECETCGRVRWWRRAHERGLGAAQEGRKVYRVKAARATENSK